MTDNEFNPCHLEVLRMMKMISMISTIDGLEREVLELKKEIIDLKNREEIIERFNKKEVKKLRKELQYARMVHTKRKQNALMLLESYQPERKKAKPDPTFVNLGTHCEVCGEKGAVVTIKRDCELTGDWLVCKNCRMTCPDCKREYTALDAYMHCLCSI